MQTSQSDLDYFFIGEIKSLDQLHYFDAYNVFNEYIDYRRGSFYKDFGKGFRLYHFILMKHEISNTTYICAQRILSNKELSILKNSCQCKYHKLSWFQWFWNIQFKYFNYLYYYLFNINNEFLNDCSKINYGCLKDKSYSQIIINKTQDYINKNDINKNH